MALEEILSEALGFPVVVSRDEPNVYWSTFETRVIESDAGTFLCKRGPTRYESGHGHRGGVAREAEVYRFLLSPLGVGPRFYGSVEHDGETWLVLEYVADAFRLPQAPRGSLTVAARWVGGFHHRYERTQPVYLPAHDADYYLGWARRARALAHERRAGVRVVGKLDRLCSRFELAVPALLEAQPTVAHGEYVPKNILIRGGETYPVDWESAMIGPGEVDLASLVHRWGERAADAAVRAYRAARWPEGVPPEHEAAFATAQLYWLLRWLGDREFWTSDATFVHLLDEVMAA